MSAKGRGGVFAMDGFYLSVCIVFDLTHIHDACAHKNRYWTDVLAVYSGEFTGDEISGGGEGKKFTSAIP